jgi:hypothetical protein
MGGAGDGTIVLVRSPPHKGYVPNFAESAGHTARTASADALMEWEIARDA